MQSGVNTIKHFFQLCLFYLNRSSSTTHTHAELTDLLFVRRSEVAGLGSADWWANRTSTLGGIVHKEMELREEVRSRVRAREGGDE